MPVNHADKCDLLKESIYQLYSKEGRSINYISKLLLLNRKVLTDKIRSWELPEAPPQRRLTPSNEKFLNRNRQRIKSMLDNDYFVTDIGEQLGTTSDYLLRTIIPQDDVLKTALAHNVARRAEQHVQRVNDLMENSSFNYNIPEIADEVWEPILGYPKYFVSNMGRVKRYAARYGAYYLLKPTPNKNNGRIYVSLQDADNKRHNLLLCRIVANTFVDGKSAEANTVNHKDGDVSNNAASNLEWCSQSENNTHVYRELNRAVVNKRRYNFKYILYKSKYQFKTVAALARFLKKSETQVRRYLDKPSEHELELVNDCND